MASYHLEHKVVSRGKRHSFTERMSYMRGEKLREPYSGRTFYHYRHDVLWTQVFLPRHAPPEYGNIQTLCNEIDRAEVRYDARTAREFIGALPNELSLTELKRIVYEFVTQNFVEKRLCAVAAIHEGKNASQPEHNNPHVHILVSTRALGPDGFSKTKNRELDKKDSLLKWREQWAAVQNRAYKRCGLDARVTHESLAIQGKDGKSVRLTPKKWREKQQLERERGLDKDRAARNRDVKVERDRELERGAEREFGHKIEKEMVMERKR